ncbi:hypothetical protein CBR_g3979 [Chara braunii]|uniref:Large ribosomal subunit protein bL21m n=1 Tax=Chara braunii TaxID=69332 RepID=A0A388KGT9_CHABU|nr:hypothetical protein CBR_g3979 [Chara braunii]|eukprot:GBG69280.1 hypothetical protein CBR_g3979 [Chara braunii]
MAAVCRRRATQFLSTPWRRGFDPNVVSMSAAPSSIARADQPRHRHQQGWMSSLSGAEKSPSLLYPPASSCNFSHSQSSIHPAIADNDEQTRRRRRWLSTHLAVTSSSSSFSSSSSSFDSSSSSSCPPPSAALLLPSLPTQRRGCLSLFLPSPSSGCDGQGRPRGRQPSHGDGGNRLMVGPRVLFSCISFSARGERYLPSGGNLTRSVNDLSHPSSSSSSPSSLSRGVSSQASMASLSRGVSSQARMESVSRGVSSQARMSSLSRGVSHGTVQSVVDGDIGICSSSSSSSSTSAASYPSPSSSFWLSSSLSSSFSSCSSSSSSSSSPSSTAAAAAATVSFEPPISEEDSTAASSSFSQASVVDVNNKEIREEDKDSSPHPDEQRMSVSAAADRDLDDANLDNGSEETTNLINQRPETDEAAEIGYSLIGKIDVKDEPYSEKPQALFAVVQGRDGEGEVGMRGGVWIRDGEEGSESGNGEGEVGMRDAGWARPEDRRCRDSGRGSRDREVVGMGATRAKGATESGWGGTGPKVGIARGGGRDGERGSEGRDGEGEVGMRDGRNPKTNGVGIAEREVGIEKLSGWRRQGQRGQRNRDGEGQVALEKVLLLGSVSRTIIGRPTIAGALVRAAVEEQALDAKVIIFKKKRRKNYRRTRGHRQCPAFARRGAATTGRIDKSVDSAPINKSAGTAAGLGKGEVV